MSKTDFLTFATSSTSSASTISTNGTLTQYTASIPADFSILLTDTLESPATFLLTHFINKALREPRKVILVGVGQGFDYYASILRKNGLQLPNERLNNNLFFVEADTTLRQIYVDVETGMKSFQSDQSVTGPLVLIDDLSALLWSGHSATDVARLCYGIRARVSELGGSLVTLLHADDLSAGGGDDEDGQLFRRVLQQCDLWLQTTRLSSQTRGELSIHRGPALVQDYGIVERSGMTAWQYKLDETGPTFSIKGLGKFL